MAGRAVPDDAVVVRIPSGALMIQTLDFFTPLTDDPYLFGQIAAANSLSDVYAMGGTPFAAMNICCFPLSKLGPDILADMLRGGAERVAASGAIAAGGHTVEDSEPKFGLSVTGFVEEGQMTTKDGAAPGQLLVLSKPLGTGILTTAVKRGLRSESDIKDAFDGMKTLNAQARDLMVEAGVKAATDITGYGLLGHAWEMIRDQSVRFVFEAHKLPLYEGTKALADDDVFPGGSRANRQWLEGLDAIRWHSEVSESWRGIACDAQTSGGLLMCWPPDQEVPPELTVVGRVEEADSKPVLEILP